MKKVVCVLLALVLLLCGCGAPAAGKETESTQNRSFRAQIGGEEVAFEAWEQEGLPTEGCYYLTQDVVLTEPVTVSGQLKLHLNSHTVQADGKTDYGSLFFVPAGGELVLYDEAEGTGAVISPRSITAKPIVTSMFAVGGTVTLAGGTVDASAINIEDVGNGAAFYVQTGGVLNVIGGTLIGGTTICYSLDPMISVDEDAAQSTDQEEQAEQEEPKTVELFGKGGSVYIAKGGLCNVNGGTIQNGMAGLGGNIYTEEDLENPGVLNLTGGMITGGEALFHGGNVYNAGTVQMSDGEISLGQAYNHGGNLFVSGTLEMTGGIISGGHCAANGMSGKRGGNILVSGDNAVIHISNAQLIDGNASGSENFGGNISVILRGAREFVVTDTTITGGMGHRGGNIYIGNLEKTVNDENLDYTMSNVTVSNGTCSYRGSNICLDSDVKAKPITLDMDNCDLIASESSSSDNLAIGAGATYITYCHVTMNGGSIQNGILTIYGVATLTVKDTEMTMDTCGGGGEIITAE